MCGRMIQATPVAEVARLFGTAERPNLRPRYNLAPTQEAAAVRLGGDGARHLAVLAWGLVPHWADDPSIGPSIGNRLINARAETAAEKPAFRSAYRKRRLLVPVDGFYEWAAVPHQKRKQPYAVRRRDRAPFALAGLWESWAGPKDRPAERREPPLETLTILTTAANATLAPIHDRMPVVIAESDWDRWLDPATPPDRVRDLLRPADDSLLDLTAVGPAVNRPANDDESLLEPVDAPRSLF